MTTAREVHGVTCLGCGCACDDIVAIIEGARIVEARGSCAKGATWFGDGAAPARARVDGTEQSLDKALDCMARLLSDATRPLVYLAPGISCEAQRHAVALADRLGASVDSVTSTTTRHLVLAFQERGAATATLGEMRHRADLVVFWGVDPDVAYPRFTERYLPDGEGLHMPEGHARMVMAVDVGTRRGPSAATLRVAVPTAGEVAVLTALRALVVQAEPSSPEAAEAAWGIARTVAATLAQARYIAVVADAERTEEGPWSPAGASALIALVQALNGPARAALILLRGGGNRNGADAVLTSQTGYPMAVDFSRGFPRYRPHDGTANARLERREVDAVLVVGDVREVPSAVASRLGSVPHAIIGAQACAGVLGGGASAIDAATIGIHESGMAFRMDDVPLSLRALVEGPPTVTTVLDTLTARVRRRH